MKFLILYFFIIFSIFSSDQSIYQIVDIKNNSDFDYTFLKNINSVDVPYPKDSSFQIGDFKYKKGKYKIIKFMNVDYGDVSYSKKKILIHKILVLKLKNNKILDGYHYTLEWQDVPSYSLWKVTAKTNLKKDMTFDELKLSPFEPRDEKPTPTFHPGVLDNVFQHKKVFP
ncbi:MAG: hypothetical protein KDK36_02720 [Leptospiraceae bacterium]|nr:hypothetical protein [Leptospiraceae bacterium]